MVIAAINQCDANGVPRKCASAPQSGKSTTNHNDAGSSVRVQSGNILTNNRYPPSYL
jgi:hypothetical protein